MTLTSRLEEMLGAYDRITLAAGGSRPSSSLQEPETEERLDRAEEAMGRLLSSEARELYAWHNGSLDWLAPTIDFARFDRSRDLWRLMVDFSLPPLTNGPGSVEPGELFPVFSVDLPLCVATSVGLRRATSPLLVLDSENDQLTIVARTLGDFIDRLTAELENGNAGPTEHGISWREGGFLAFPLDMEPWAVHPSG